MASDEGLIEVVDLRMWYLPTLKKELLPFCRLLQQMQVPKRELEQMSMDFVEGLSNSKKNDLILVIVDTFTKYPLTHPFTAWRVAMKYM